MGIKGLTSFLQKFSGNFFPSCVVEGAFLVVDGNGWLFYLMEKCNNDVFEPCGDYSMLNSLVEQEVHYLRHNRGFKLVVVFDGGDQRMKSHTSAKRKLEREEKVMNLYQLCSNKRSYEWRDLPMPSLSSSQFKSTLTILGVDIVVMKGEGDQDIASMCNSFTRNGTLAYCYGNDSDFYLMKDIHYIQFEELYSSRSSQVTSSDSETSPIKVYTRKSIAACLGLSESQLIEFAILAGNDFTSSFMKEEFRWVDQSGPALPPVKWTHNEMLEFIRATDPTFKLESRNSSLQLAIDFSRDFYELQDLSGYPLDIRQEVGMPLSLTVDMKQDLHIWITETLGEEGASFEGVGTIALAFLMGIVDEGDVGSYSKYVKTHEQVEALSIMLHRLKDGSLELASERNKKREWDDVMFLSCYQLICRELVDMLVSWPTTVDMIQNTLLEPRQYFNAVIFFSEISFIRFSKNMLGTESTSLSRSHRSGAPTIDMAGSAHLNIQTLPIDAYRDTILHKIEIDRVTIIHGETGCGKSSRVPVMILEDARSKGKPCKMMVSQPRRIAASSLMRRVKEVVGDEVGYSLHANRVSHDMLSYLLCAGRTGCCQVGLRMGFGARVGGDEAKILFVTTGYLVRLLAHHPEIFNEHTHIIIDECHERSVDGDVLCLLVRRLLQKNDSIHVVLMSATMHMQLYRDYFSSDDNYFGTLDCLSVGAKRFPVQICYVEDVLTLPNVTPKIKTMVERVSKSRVLEKEIVTCQYALALHIVNNRASLGTGVLIFVAGIHDINELTELFSGRERYNVVAIHSELPIEEQDRAFDLAKSHEVKVVIATNAAESSITLPDVDLVICLGQQKLLTSDSSGHMTRLDTTLISKASATQRSGRTGRVRPGCCFRLYSQELFNTRFIEHNVSEVQRVPLHDTILSLRCMFQSSDHFDGVVSILEDLMEPPEVENIEISFDFLERMGAITSADDDGELTPMGRVMGALPVGVSLGRVLGFSIWLGITEEACAVVAALSMPKSPYRIANPIIHSDPVEYCTLVRKIYTSAYEHDQRIYSEPIMLYNLLCDWRRVPTAKQDQWCHRNGVVKSRIKQLDSTTKNLLMRVHSVTDAKHRPHDRQNQIKLTSAEKINFLRLIMLWSYQDCILKMDSYKATKPANVITLNNSKPLSISQLETLFPSQEIPYVMKKDITKIFQTSVGHKLTDMWNVISVMDGLNAVASTHSIPLVWMVCKTGQYLSVHRHMDRLDALTSVNKEEIQLPHTFQESYCGYTISSMSKTNKAHLKALRESLEVWIEFKVVGKKSVITCWNCPDMSCEDISEPLRARCPSLGKVSYDSSCKPSQILEFPVPEEEQDRGYFFHDVPFGIRLFNAYKTGYNHQKQVLVRKDMSSDGGQKAPVVGSQEWAQMKQQQTVSSTQRGEEDTIGVDAVCPSPSWTAYVDYGMTTVPMKAVLQRHSVPACSVHLGEGPLFALCCAPMIVKKVTICAGVSILPAGTLWIRLAMMCVGLDPRKYVPHKLCEEDDGFIDDMFDLVLHVSNFFSSSAVQTDPIQYNHSLVGCLRELFDKWTSFDASSLWNNVEQEVIGSSFELADEGAVTRDDNIASVDDDVQAVTAAMISLSLDKAKGDADAEEKPSAKKGRKKAFTCNIAECSRTFASVGALGTHQRNKHVVELDEGVGDSTIAASSKIHRCTVSRCGSCFNSPKKLQNHVFAVHRTFSSTATADSSRTSLAEHCSHTSLSITARESCTTKKMAKALAAADMLEKLSSDPSCPVKISQCRLYNSNPVMILNELMQKSHFKVPVYDVFLDASGRYSCILSVNFT